MGQHGKALALSCAGSPPVPYGTAPVGHWGPYSPNPLRRFALRALYLSPPVPYGTAPVGHWGPYSPNPLRRFALRALYLSPPVPYGTAPVGHWGPYSPNPLRRFAPSLLFCIITIIFKKYFWICFLIWMCRDYIRHFWNAGV